MKKASYVFLDILTIAFLIGAYMIQYFTKRKLGMLRWINYQNMKIQKNEVYGTLKYVTVVVAIVLIALIVVEYNKKKGVLRKIDLVSILIMLTLGIAYLTVTVFMSTESIASYYFLMPLLGASTLMQIVRNGIAVAVNKNQK